MIGIIGGGITGLTAAYALRQQGFEVRLLEERAGAGGMIQSERHDGFLVERGPQSLMDRNPQIGEMVRALGIEPERMNADKVARKRYIVKNGKLAALPSSPATLLTSRVFSLRGKCRLLLEPLIRARNGEEDESVAGFVERRLGREVLDYAVNPFVSGIFAGEPAALSVRHAFPKLYAFERDHGSLLKGGIRQRRNNGRKSETKGGLFSFREGLATLPKALAASLSDSISLNARVTGLSRAGHGWVVSWIEGDRESSKIFERVLIAAPAHRVPALNLSPAPFSPVADLEKLPYSPISVLALGFRRSAVEHPLDGFGFLVPKTEALPVLGVGFSSSIYPNRAPEGHVLLSVYMGGARQPELAGCSKEEQISLVLPVLARLLGVTAAPVFSQRIHWAKGIPQYNIGHSDFLQTMNSLEAEKPGVFLAGNYRDGISLGECIGSGFAAADRVISSLS